MELVYSYSYNSQNQIHSITDHASEQVTTYEYDRSGRIIESHTYDSSTFADLSSVELGYDQEDRLSFQAYVVGYSSSVGTRNATTSYAYDYSPVTGNLSLFTIQGSGFYGTVSPVYDNLGRTMSRTATLENDSAYLFYSKQEYEYEVGQELYDTYQVSYMANTIGKTQSTANVNAYWYEYDALGNITKILNDNATTLYQYEYDNLGHTVTE